MKERTWLMLSLLILLIAVGARVIPGPRTIDDAYISFRYARNLISGQGLVYNVDEKVLGTTTPLYTFILSAIGLLFGSQNVPFPAIALGINAIADASTCWMLICLGKSIGSRKAGIGAALIWAVAPFSVTFAIGGMETSLFVALATATFYMYSVDRPVLMALSASLSLLTRPDALIFLLPIAVDRVRRIIPIRKINPDPLPFTLPEAAAFFPPVVTWLLISTLYFGTPLPNTISAKVAAYSLPKSAALIRLLQHYATPFLGHLTFGNLWIGVGLLLFLTLYCLGAVTAIRNSFQTWPILIFPCTYFLAYAIANPLIFRWYLTPPLPIYILAIFLGLERIAKDFPLKYLGLGGILLATFLTVRGWTIRPDHGSIRPAPKMAFIKLELLYEKVGRELRDRVRSDETLASGDIGAIGYYSNAKILDTVGLISPGVEEYYPLDPSAYAINYAMSSALIMDFQPEYLVLLEAYGRNTLLQDPDFLEKYSLVDVFETDIYGSDGMLLYELK